MRVRFAHPDKTRTFGKAYSINYCKAHVLAGRIHRRAQSLKAIPFYRALYDYGKLNQLTKPIATTWGSSGVPRELWLISSSEREKVQTMKEEAAHGLRSCLRDQQVQKLERAATSLGKVPPLRWLSGLLQKAVDAYADAEKTDSLRGKKSRELGKERPFTATVDY